MENDAGLVYVSNIYGAAPNEHDDDAAAGGSAAENGHDNTMHRSMGNTRAAVDVRLLCKDFVEHFHIKNRFPYMDLLRDNLAAGLFFIEVQLDHLQQFSGVLFAAVQHSPTRTLPVMESAIWELAGQCQLFPSGDGTVTAMRTQGSIQVQLFWAIPPLPLRQLAHATVARLVCVSGIVVKASSSHARCVRAAIQCTSCRSKAYISGGRSLDLPPQCLDGGGGYAGVAQHAGMPPASSSSSSAAAAAGGSRRRCRPNPYVLLPMECWYEDQQVLKLQELPEDVPTGELPRHLTLILDRYLVDRMSPGARVQVVGIVSVQEKRGVAADGGGGGRPTASSGRAGRRAVGLRAQYLRGVGVMHYTMSAGRTSHGGSGGGVVVRSMTQNYSTRVHTRSATAWQPHEEAGFKSFAKSGRVYEQLSQSIDPAVYGLTDPKRAIVCLLFGGTRKRRESNFLRGDMNVLLLGDPSTAKSQLLKFTEKVAPIGVYTSGKGSSAAGLTASVISNGGGDFVLEAGSMVLADGGVCCIDEFDKMREQDQVAIHEAMEQQTISIAKANLTTMLNSRTSVLAAANPTLGAYDPLRSNEDQMDFQGSILSRFDLIFKVLDQRNPEMDHKLAQHVVALHKGIATARQTAHAPVERGFFTKYVAYARATCHPVLSEDAMKTLLDFYVRVRRDAHRQTLETLAQDGGGNSHAVGGSSRSRGQAPAIQITARQLESLVRISESLARMRLDVLASKTDAMEAIRLFKTATVDAISGGLADQMLTEAQSAIVLRIEEALRRRVALGATVEHSRLLAEMARMGFDVKLVDRAVYALVKREELEWRKQRSLIYRAR